MAQTTLQSSVATPITDTNPTDALDQSVWRERRLDAVLRAAQIEIAILESEIGQLKAQLEENSDTIHNLNYQLFLRGSEIELHWEAQKRLHAEIARLSDADYALHRKDRQIRRLRHEMRLLQDFIEAAHLAEAQTRLAAEHNRLHYADLRADLLQREQAVAASAVELVRIQNTKLFRFAAFYWDIVGRLRRLLQR